MYFNLKKKTNEILWLLSVACVFGKNFWERKKNVVQFLKRDCQCSTIENFMQRASNVNRSKGKNENKVEPIKSISHTYLIEFYAKYFLLNCQNLPSIVIRMWNWEKELEKQVELDKILWLRNILRLFIWITDVSMVTLCIHFAYYRFCFFCIKLTRLMKVITNKRFAKCHSIETGSVAM